MDLQILYQITKTLHIVGFIIAIGITLSTYIAYNQFWSLYKIDKVQGLAAFKTFQLLQHVGMLGLVLVLIAGIFMLALVNFTFIHSLWFQLKLGLIVLMFLNGFTLGRTSTLQLQSFLIKDATDIEANKDPQQLQIRLRTFQIVQLCMYMVIILLSVFRIT